MDQWMFDASPATFFHADMENARLLLVLGTNPRISNRGHNPTESFKRFVEDPTRRMVVVDPRETETTRGAHRHLRVRPGTDAIAPRHGRGDRRNELVDYEFVRGARLRDPAPGLATVDADEMARRSRSTPLWWRRLSSLAESAAIFTTSASAGAVLDVDLHLSVLPR
jgi:hypothetical protein